jgi:hypothetical protein
MSEQNRKRPCRLGPLSAGFALLVCAQPAHAYMDPGSMSVIVTAILGAIAAIGYTARMYWARFRALLARMLARFGRGERPRDGE